LAVQRVIVAAEKRIGGGVGEDDHPGAVEHQETIARVFD
jgi:hypothetical protein